MSILNNLTSFFEPKPIPIRHEDCKPARPDDCGDGKESKWNDDKWNDGHKGRDHWKNDDKDEYSKHGGKNDYSKHAKSDDDNKDRDHWKNGDKDEYSKHDKDYSKHARNDDDSKDRDHWKNGDKDEHSKHDKHDYSKHAKNDDCSDDGRKDGDSKHHGKDEYSKDGKGDDWKHDGGWKDAKNDDCQPHKDHCQPEKDYCAPKPSDDCGKGDAHHNNTGEALARFDFSHGNFGSHGPDHSGDMQGALASMSSDHALDYAIDQMGPADHFDIGHDDVTSHDTVHHA